MDVCAEGLIPIALGDGDDEVALLDVAQLTDVDRIASRYLTSHESTEFAALTHPMRRLEWLGARVCLKAMLHRSGALTDPRQCVVAKDRRGRPHLSLLHRLSSHTPYDCSLSHAGQFAAASVTRRRYRRVGLDVEQISPRVGRAAELFLSSEDVLLGNRSADIRAAVVWALKEAYAKVVGDGFGVALAGVSIHEISEGRHSVITPGGRQLPAWHVARDRYVIALCVSDDKER